MLYEDLKDRNFEIIAVALDTGGKAAVEASIRPSASDLAGRSEAVRQLMGWGDSVWRRIAAPEYPCLIDEEHVVGALYGITNVPMAVWIDEHGTIVRPAEPAGHSDYFRRKDYDTGVIPDEDIAVLQSNRTVYFEAVRDWVENGDQSEYVLSADEVRRRLRVPSERDVRAAAHARIGRHLFREGEVEAAKRHFRAAVDLCPENWSYRRQSMVLDPELVGQLNTSPEYYDAREALGDRLYYPTIDMPGIAGPPPWLAPTQS